MVHKYVDSDEWWFGREHTVVMGFCCYWLEEGCIVVEGGNMVGYYRLERKWVVSGCLGNNRFFRDMGWVGSKGRLLRPPLSSSFRYL